MRSPLYLSLRLEPWYKRLVRWAKSYFAPKPPPAVDNRIIQQWATAWGTLYLLRRNTPEAIDRATFRFLPAYTAGISVLLTCDTYRAIGVGRGSRSATGSLGIRHGAPIHGHPVPSHRLSFTVVEEAFAAGSALVKTSLIWSYPVDFVGANGLVADPDKFARRITADLAQLLLYKYLDEIKWEEEIHAIAHQAVGSSHEILITSESRRAN